MTGDAAIRVERSREPRTRAPGAEELAAVSGRTMDILLDITRAQRMQVILHLCREWNEEHPEQPAEREWVEEMIAARARWSEMLRRHDPAQGESYSRYDEFRARLPLGLVVRMLDALP